jgi:hypothetical protein
MYEDVTYITFSLTEINLINFDEVLQTSANTIRRSIDQTKGIISWKGNTPSCVNLLTTKSQFYTHAEMFQIVNTSEWVDPNEIY